MVQDLDIAAAVRDAASAVNAESTIEETLQAIVDAAVQSMSEIDHAGITLVQRRDLLETTAATSDFVRELDRLQYQAGEGPCLSALGDTGASVVLVERARHEARWPEFIPAAVRQGLQAQLGVRMFVSDDDATVGVLNLYSTVSDTISAETQDIAEMFATHAALAYRHRQQLTSLHDAMTTREVIGKAIGITMQRYELDSGRAFEYLTRVCATTETKLRDVATELVRSTDEAHTHHP